MVIKTDTEREALHEGGRILASVLRDLAAMVQPGVTSVQLDQRAHELIAAQGAKPAFFQYQPDGANRPFPGALCLSVNDAIVHGIPNEEEFVIQDGDVVTLDAGVTWKQLHTDSAITVIAGNASKEDARLVSAVQEALVAGVAAARAGSRVGDISAAIEAVARKYGVGVPAELGGHGIGYEVHEEPFVANVGTAGTGPELVLGQVIAIEPIFTNGGNRATLDADGYTYRTADGSRAAQAEHTLIVGERGGEVVTRV